MADYLVRKQVPFRQAHEIVGKIVAWSEGNDKPLDQLSLAEFKQFNANFAADVLDLFKPHHALSHRNIAGGTGPQSVRRQIEKARQLLTSVG
jgi:argininosuccinate lyase